MLKLENIRKTFGAVVALDDLSLEIKTGEVFGLLGPNGAGKTTAVNISVGLLAPDSGMVAIGGHGSPLDPRVRSKVGVAPQALAIYEELTGRENLTFLGRMQGLGGRRLKERVDEALAFVGLADRAKDQAKKYSGGMKRRLNLAGALLHRPPLLFLDEPTAGVDPQSRNAVYENILALRAGGCTVIYTTHYMEEAQRLCDRVGIIDRGRLMALDTVDGLINAHGGPSVLVATCGGEELRLAAADPLAELNRLHAQGRLETFRVDRPDLEQVFLNLTGKTLRD